MFITVYYSLILLPIFYAAKSYSIVDKKLFCHSYVALLKFFEAMIKEALFST